MGFIVHYENGNTIAETRGAAWEDVDKKHITSLQILRKGVHHSLVIPKGYYGVFQHKVGWAFFGREDLNVPKSDTQIGVVINSGGDCIIMNVEEKTGHSKVYVDNVKRMKMNLELHGIKLP